jgi:hypothetical protein
MFLFYFLKLVSLPLEFSDTSEQHNRYCSNSIVLFGYFLMCRSLFLSKYCYHFSMFLMYFFMLLNLWHDFDICEGFQFSG